MGRLFEETRIRGMALRNRLVRPATWMGLAAEDGTCTGALVEALAALPEGGAGLIVTGHASVHPQGQHQPRQLGICRDGPVPGLRRLTGAVHDRGGSIVVQLGYGGAYLSRSRVRDLSAVRLRPARDGEPLGEGLWLPLGSEDPERLWAALRDLLGGAGEEGEGAAAGWSGKGVRS
ncbi:MAG: hypothetical protein Kow0092_23590 [Deferrisomatales bacterium]